MFATHLYNTILAMFSLLLFAIKVLSVPAEDFIVSDANATNLSLTIDEHHRKTIGLILFRTGSTYYPASCLFYAMTSYLIQL